MRHENGHDSIQQNTASSLQDHDSTDNNRQYDGIIFKSRDNYITNGWNSKVWKQQWNMRS